jgi:hypothetical protein
VYVIQTQLDALSREGYRLYFGDLRFERLDVDAGRALEMFADNRYKTAQIPAMAARSDSVQFNSMILFNVCSLHCDFTQQ